MSILDGPIWSRCIIALTCPARSHFQRTLSRESWVQGWNERYRSSKEKEEWGDEDGQEREKTGNRFQRSCVLPFCGRSGESTAKRWFKGSARGNLDPREGQKPFRPNPNGVGDRTSTLRRPLIGTGIFFGG